MTLIALLLLAGALFVAYANGANDNFKGVATLYGSGTLSYRTALVWATVTTLLGSLLSVALASKLVKAFSAKGLVPDGVAAQPEFLAAVAIGAAFTVFLATVTGFPISTTHALTGALIGSGWVSVGSAVNFARLGTTFFLPLAVSPLLGVILGAFAFAVVRRVGALPAFKEDYCVCIDSGSLVPLTLHASTLAVGSGPSLALEPPAEVTLARAEACTSHSGPSVVLRRGRIVDALHFLSSGAVSFARGLNDAPKIVGLLVVLQALHLRVSLVLVAAVMAIGGFIQARRVAETVSHRITKMTEGEGLIANLVTSGLVLSASYSGLPVSTTHVSCSSIFGMGFVTGKADRTVVKQILLSWLITLPVAAAIAGVSSFVLRG